MAKEPTYEILTAWDGTKVRYYPTPHWYKIDGDSKYLLSPSSITGILDKSEALLIWNGNLMRDYFNGIAEAQYNKQDLIDQLEFALGIRKTKLESAKDVGTFIHDYAEATAYNRAGGLGLPEMPELPQDDAQAEQVLNGIKAFIQFEAENIKSYIDVECFVFSKAEHSPYVGRFDAILDLNGVPTLIDWKSSKGVYSSQKYQLAGYDIAKQEECKALGKPLPYTQIAVIHIDKNTGIPTLHVLSEEERALAQAGFRGLLMTKTSEKVLNKWSK